MGSPCSSKDSQESSSTPQFKSISFSALSFLYSPTLKSIHDYRKNHSFDYAKAFDCVDHNKLWKIVKEVGIPDHLTCLLRNVCAGQEATVRTRHGTTDWIQIGKGVCQGCILSPCLFNLYSEDIVRMNEASWNQDCWKKYQHPQICR